MSAQKKKQLRIVGKIFFIIYILFLLYFLIFSDWYGRDVVMEDYHYNLRLFREIKRFWSFREQLGVWSLVNLVGNVVIFIPFGFFEPIASRQRSFFGTVFDGLLVSMLVEMFQLISKVGRFDVDDLLLNTFGVLIGYLIFIACNAVRRAYDAKRTRERT